MARIAGLVLAAGAGKRMGVPKALLTHADGSTFIERSCQVLLDSGCWPVIAMIGAGAEHITQVFSPPEGVQIVRTKQWEQGMSASLRQGLEHLITLPTNIDAAVIHLVDLPGVGSEAVGQVLAALSDHPQDQILRASYHGHGGHPVVIGVNHFEGIQKVARGDSGAREYFYIHHPDLVEVGNVATGTDVDTPADLQWPHSC